MPTIAAADRQSGARDTRARSWHPRPAPGVYAAIDAWTTADDWLAALTHTLDTDAGREQLARAHITTEAVLRVARDDARRADHSTGRDVATAHDTVAATVDVSPSTVRRARGVLEALGFSRTVVGGRYLTTRERQEARQAHGGRQVRCASVRALTVPRGCSYRRDEQLPQRGQVGSVRSPRKSVPKAARARPGTPRRPEPRPLPVQRLAAGLAARLPWLARGHLGALCDVLAALDLDADGWTAQDVIEALDRRNRDRGLCSVAPGRQRNPLGLLVTQLQEAVAVMSPPQHQRARDADARRAARERAREAARDAEARRASPDAVRRHTAACRHALRAARTP